MSRKKKPEPPPEPAESAPTLEDWQAMGAKHFETIGEGWGVECPACGNRDSVPERGWSFGPFERGDFLSLGPLLLSAQCARCQLVLLFGLNPAPCQNVTNSAPS